MNKYEVTIKGVFVNSFTVEVEDQDQAGEIAFEQFWFDTGDCISSSVIAVEESDND